MWGLKAATIAVALYFCLSVNFSLQNFEGWPSDTSLPQEFRVHWIVVEEPDKKGGEGAVYVWANTIEDVEDEPKWWFSFEKDNTNAPRAYRLPYSRDLHERAQEALERLQAGKGVMGKNGIGEAQEGEGGGSEGDNGGTGGGSLTKNGGVTFQELPPTKLPDKGE